MCGIAGLVGDFVPGLMERMNAAQRHRGPDAEGVFEDKEGLCQLAHVRLSILDLSSAANQPMQSDDGRYTLVYNGEIYNFRELRSELESRGWRFRSTGDTEVLLKGLIQFGEAFVERLNGMFAFAMWDNVSRELLIARDQLGIKPLYYCSPRPGTLLFSSEIKPMLGYPSFEALPEPVALFQHLVFCYALSERTAFKGLFRLQPGYLARWRSDDRVLRTTRYWSPPSQDFEGTPEEAVVILKYTLKAAVERQMIADVPVGMFLSGGLDSSYLTALAKARAREGFKCFTIEWPAADNRLDAMDPDLPHATAFAKRLGLDLHVTTLHHSVTDLCSQLVWHLDEPLVDPAAISAYLICREARASGTPVLLSGQGADELFCGYPRYRVMKAREYLNIFPSMFRMLAARGSTLLPGTIEGSIGAAVRRIKRALIGLEKDPMGHFLNMSAPTPLEAAVSVLSPDFLATVDTGSIIGERDPRYESLGHDGFAGFRWRDLSVYLPNHNLLYTDKMSMAMSIETRVPYLDTELVNTTLRLPAHWMVGSMRTKNLLRTCAKGTVPDSIIHRAKAGLGAPYRKWLRYDLEEMWGDLLSRESVERRGWFSYDGLQAARARSQEGRDDLYMLQWAALTMELWARNFLDYEPNFRQNVRRHSFLA